ncbi:DUF2812 domain-containing protein [Terribacillus saccharophilus]|uniref:DUF2812 domain-containing protein n=1 Tax=Terribacillus saccharophilus TaxID=361277 RepID=A0A268ACX1_9BACI|nr:DUF2812 domain-containing protein [Terribacillus saccharophilus]PAD21972.1 hypothetical protein CHH64_04815 [Terribacillus saccharophilus]
MIERKKIRKWFWAWDDQKEEVWLQQMAQQGWVLEEYKWFRYTFKAAAPSELVYRLDYRMGFPDRSYFDLFEMDGWKFISTFSGWHYFCKEDDRTDKLEIFTDMYSRAAKYIQISNLMTFILLSHVLSFWVPVITNQGSFPVWIEASIAPVSLLCIYAIYKLRRKAKQLKEIIV